MQIKSRTPVQQINNIHVHTIHIHTYVFIDLAAKLTYATNRSIVEFGFK